jgi:hypothetical protein
MRCSPAVVVGVLGIIYFTPIVAMHLILTHISGIQSGTNPAPLPLLKELLLDL